MTLDHETAVALSRAVRRQIERLRDFPRKNAAELCTLRAALAQIEAQLTSAERADAYAAAAEA